MLRRPVEIAARCGHSPTSVRWCLPLGFHKKEYVRRLIKITAISLGVLVLIVSVWAIYIYTFHVHYHGPVERVSFQSGDDVTMKGWFIKPNETGVYPAVVILHGSGPMTGDDPAIRIMANAFLRSGISVLTYDKRGVGSSGGNFLHSRYDDFVEDGINAVRYLETRNVFCNIM